MSQRASNTANVDSEDSDRGVRMTVLLSNADEARKLLKFLGHSLPEQSVSVECVAETDSKPCVIHVDDMTDRQLSAAQTAVACGYYDDPKDAELADIATELDRSESAISPRLSAVKRKLVRAIVESCEQ